MSLTECCGLDNASGVQSTVFWHMVVIQWASLVAQMVKNLCAMRDTWVWCLGREDPLEKGMAAPSSVLTWRTPWTEKPGGLYTPWDYRQLDTIKWHTHVQCTFPGWFSGKESAWQWSWEDPLEEEMATHSSILAWKIPWAEEPSGSKGVTKN